MKNEDEKRVEGVKKKGGRAKEESKKSAEDELKTGLEQ